MICRLPGPAVEKSGEILREASTALKLAQRLDQSSFFVVEELHLGAGICGEPRLENHAEIVGRGVGRARLKLLDEQLGGFRRDREVPLVDRHAELLGDEPRLLEVARQLVGRVRRLSAPRGDVASPKLAASLIPKAADPKTPPVNPRMASSESLALPLRVLAQQHAAELLEAGGCRVSVLVAWRCLGHGYRPRDELGDRPRGRWGDPAVRLRPQALELVGQTWLSGALDMVVQECCFDQLNEPLRRLVVKHTDNRFALHECQRGNVGAATVGSQQRRRKVGEPLPLSSSTSQTTSSDSRGMPSNSMRRAYPISRK